MTLPQRGHFSPAGDGKFLSEKFVQARIGPCIEHGVAREVRMKVMMLYFYSVRSKYTSISCSSSK
jgi:hypothetical protein